MTPVEALLDALPALGARMAAALDAGAPLERDLVATAVELVLDRDPELAVTVGLGVNAAGFPRYGTVDLLLEDEETRAAVLATWGERRAATLSLDAAAAAVLRAGGYVGSALLLVGLPDGAAGDAEGLLRAGAWDGGRFLERFAPHWAALETPGDPLAPPAAGPTHLPEAFATELLGTVALEVRGVAWTLALVGVEPTAAASWVARGEEPRARVPAPVEEELAEVHRLEAFAAPLLDLLADLLAAGLGLVDATPAAPIARRLVPHEDDAPAVDLEVRLRERPQHPGEAELRLDLRDRAGEALAHRRWPLETALEDPDAVAREVAALLLAAG